MKLVQLLFIHRAEVEYADTEGNTALHIACQDEMFDVAKLLTEHAADIHKKNKEGKTPLDYVKPGTAKILQNTYQQTVIPR